MAFAAERGQESPEVYYEVYVNDPDETPEHELETLLMIPLP
jgi:effector-binding domain-containing protein